MQILTRYLSKDIFYFFAITLAILCSLLLIYEVFDTKDELFGNNPKLSAVILFLLYSTPTKLSQALPIICWISTCFAYGFLAKNREILAMVAAGVSYRHLVRPALFFGAVITVAAFFFNEYFVPDMESRARFIEKVVIKGQDESDYVARRNLFVKGSGARFYFMEEYNSSTATMEFPSIFMLREDGRGLEERIEATSGKRVEEGGGNAWEFLDAYRWTFNQDGSLRAYEHFDKPYRIQMEDQLEKFLARSKEPEEMGYDELAEYRALLEDKGGEEVSTYSTALQQKLAFPLACLAMAILGFATAVDILARHLARGFMIGLTVTVGYYMLMAFMRNLGQEGTVNAFVAGWVPTLAFGAVVGYLFMQIEKVRG